MTTVPDVSYSYNSLASETATTQRNVSGTGMTAHLTGLALPDLYPASTGDIASIVSDSGLEGAAREYKQAFIRKQSHVDDGVTVDQLPDIREGDNLVLNGVTYRVRMAEEWHFWVRLVVGQMKGAN